MVVLYYNPIVHALDTHVPAICAIQAYRLRRVLIGNVAVPKLAITAVSKRHNGAILHQQHGVRATRRHLLGLDEGIAKVIDIGIAIYT